MLQRNLPGYADCGPRAVPAGTRCLVTLRREKAMADFKASAGSLARIGA
jgi:hypothetical protein